jgi:hypothetical protein
MFNNNHGALGQKLAAREHRQDPPCLVRRVGWVHEHPAKDSALGRTGHALQGAEHTRSNDTSPTGETKLAQIPMQDP